MAIAAAQRSLEKPSFVDNIRRDQKLGLIGSSDIMDLLRKKLVKAANSDFNVLITGETGTGKELAARAIHSMSRRYPFPYVVINSPGITETLAESELFGSRAKSYTGAPNIDVNGKIAYADNGTLFIDEISELTPSIQAKLLRLIQEGEYTLVGDTRVNKIDTRIIAATNKDLSILVKEGKFREDLFYRLNTYSVVVPPLRYRKEDITELTLHFFNKNNFSIDFIDPTAKSFLEIQNFSGNVRELENCVKHAIIEMSESCGSALKTLKFDHINDFVFGSWSINGEKEKTNGSLKSVGNYAKEEAQRQKIIETLKSTNWNRKKAARLLGISYRCLIYKMKSFDLNQNKDQTQTTT